MHTKYIVIFILFIMFTALSAQKEANPFDLPYRLPKSSNVDTVKVVKNGPVPVQAETTIKKKSSRSISIPYSLWYLLFVSVLLAFTINMDRSSLGKLFRSANNLNFLNLMYRDQRFRYNAQNLLFYAIFILSAAYFVTALLYQFFDIDMPIYMTITVLMGIYLVRHLVMVLVQYAFPGTVEISHFSYTIFILNILLGLLLIPLDFIIGLDNHDLALPVLYLGLVAIIFMYVYRMFRGLLLSSSVIVNNKFRFFVYLCALEIAPIFLVIKIFQQF